MTNEKINIAIAKACGWSNDDIERGYALCQFTEDIPDYCNDLNAMHEAEKSLNQIQARAYSDFLGQSEQDGTWAGCHCFHQTAAQRAEAFLRTINKWEGGSDDN
jgi:uncharacterized protein (DUF1810 family)